jgi:transcriptional regulator with XRE-family HTH domain
MDERLRTLRRQHQLTQQELAEKLQVSRQTVSNWENGRSAPDRVNIAELAKAYQLPLETLLGTSVHAKPAPPAPTEQERHMTLFVVVLMFLSCITPLAAILSLFIVISWKDHLPRLLYRLAAVILTILSSVNVILIIALIVFFPF